MSQTNTKIKVKRSVEDVTKLLEQRLQFGEQFFIDNTEHNPDGSLLEPCKAYLAIGRKPDEENGDTPVKNTPVIKALSKNKSDRLVFFNENNGSIVDESDNELPVNRITAIEKSDISLDNLNNYYLLCQPKNDTGDNQVYKFTLADFGIFINNNGVLKGAAWNDYAELRPCEEPVTPGLVVCDSGEGTLKLSQEKLQACAHIVSDTYGQLIGNDRDESCVPIAVAGRALVAMDDSVCEIEIGDCVCAGPNGLASKMTRQEIIHYPDRILGVVCEIPTYKNIGSIDVDNRVWVNIK